MRTRPARIQEDVRPPAVAGTFYPALPDELRHTVGELLCRVRIEGPQSPKAIISPHAAYLFSGPVAASAHALYLDDRDIIKRVVLIGPSHHVSFNGLAATNFRYFATPLGLVPLDTDIIRWLCRGSKVSILDEPHAVEHSLEVQLPFLQVVLKSFQIVPLLTGEVTDRDVAEIITALWNGPETRFVISSDLSHYYDYDRARRLDAATSRSIEQLRPDQIMPEQACGRTPLCGLLYSSKVHGLTARTVDLRNSGDTVGPRDHVVGYGAFAFSEALQYSQENPPKDTLFTAGVPPGIAG